MKFHVLYEDNHLLVVNKPAGFATQGAAPHQPSLWTTACDYLRAKYHKPGNVYLGVVSRLDSVATGIVVFARTSKAAQRLNDQFAQRKVVKTYWAIVEGILSGSGCLQDWIYKDDKAHRMRIQQKPGDGCQYAELEYHSRKQLDAQTWLDIALKTGRKHQIRVQLSAHGFPIVGDQKYGATLPFPLGIALHSHSLTLLHPVKGTPMTFTADAPSYWPLGGPITK